MFDFSPKATKVPIRLNAQSNNSPTCLLVYLSTRQLIKHFLCFGFAIFLFFYYFRSILLQLSHTTMKPVKFIIISFMAAWVIAAGAQTSIPELLSHIELASSNYCNYPNPSGNITPAPEGYQPFYITHYGRHGARYMTDDDAYKYLVNKLDSAKSMGLLTPLGDDALQRLKVAWADALKHDGDLTKLGAIQHRAIAHRMMTNYPFLMGQPLDVRANSSTVRRCILSMANFCMELEKMNPLLSIDMNASEHDMYYIIPNDSIEIPKSDKDGELYDSLAVFKKRMLNGRHQMTLLFNDTAKATKFVDAHLLADHLWNVASDMLCLPELQLSFNDLFTKEELINGFRAYNASWCLWEGLMPGAQPNYYAIYPLLKNFIDEAHAMVASGKSGVRLRFGHDSVLLPLTYILGMKEAIHATDDMENLHNSFALFRLIPMAGNVQWVFFRKPGSNDIIVKFLLNENETSIPIPTDIFPFYHWKDVEKYYRDMLENAHITYKMV